MAVTEGDYDAFGIKKSGNFDWLEDEAPEETVVEAPQETEQPTASVETIPEPIVTEPQAIEEVPATEQTIEEVLYAGKYRDVDALEQGYKNLQSLQTKTAERATGYEREYDMAMGQVRELQETLRQVVPYIQQLEQRTGPTTPAPKLYTEDGTEVSLPPSVSPQDVETLVSRRLADARADWETQRTAAVSVENAERAIKSFWTDHNIVQYDETDNLMTETVQALNASWDRYDTEVDISDREALEVVYEAAQNPALLTVLQMRPEYFDTEDGMKLARFEASLLTGGQAITEQTATVPASMVGQRKPPVTESASTGAVAPAPSQPLNEFQEALAYQQAERRGGHKEGSPFFE